MKRLLYALGAVAIALTIEHCSTNWVDNGGGSEVEGYCAYTDGSSSVNARVDLLPGSINGIPAPSAPDGKMSIVASTLSNNAGVFHFDSVPPGDYIIEAFDDRSNAARYSGLIIGADNEEILLGELTLKPTGSLKGVVVLSGGGDPRKVFVVLSGGNRLTTPDSTGLFAFDSLAEGTYNLRLIPLLNYAVFDTVSIRVLSGTITDLGMLLPHYTGIQSPRSLALTCDTARQFVTITWQGVDDSLAIGGYNVRRRPAVGGYNYTLITSQYIPRTITSFVDTTAGQDTLYEYRVESLDTTLQYPSAWAGTSGDTIRTISIAAIIRTYVLDNEGAIDIVGDMAALTVFNDGSFAAAENGWQPMIHRYDSSGMLVKSWNLPGEPSMLKAMYIAGDDQGRTYVVNHMDEKYITVYACDGAGTQQQRWVTEKPYDYINGIEVNGTMLYINTAEDLIYVFDITDTSITPDWQYIQKPIESRKSCGLSVSSSGGSLFTMGSAHVFAFESSTDNQVASLISQWGAREDGLMTLWDSGQVIIANQQSMQACIYSVDGQFVGRFSLKQNCAEIGAIKSGPEKALYVLARNALTSRWEVRIYSVDL